MTASSPESETLLHLHAYVDGELDAPAALAMERRLAADPVLAAEHARLMALRGAIRGLPREEASPRLRDAVMGIAASRPIAGMRPVAPARFLMPRRQWLATAAALLVGLGAGSAVTYLATEEAARNPGVDEAALDQVVASHVRALAAGAPFDVASSDRHTVKPWFAGKLTFAPVVVDLSDDGFPLVGGRLDVIGTERAATLVFRHDKHLISVTELIDLRGSYGADRRGVREGFSVVHWWADGIAYWAVSDAAPEEVEALAAAFRKHAQ